jgi:hypothetical protein
MKPMVAHKTLAAALTFKVELPFERSRVEATVNAVIYSEDQVSGEEG